MPPSSARLEPDSRPPPDEAAVRSGSGRTVRIEGLSAEVTASLLRLSPGGHVCLFYERDPREQLPALIPFLQQALNQNEQFIYVADDFSVHDLCRHLEEAGIDVAHHRASGRLRLLTRDDWRQPGELDPAKKAAQVRRFIDTARLGGYAGVRFAVEMTWLLDPDISADRVEHWEAAINPLVQGKFPVRIVCQYNRSRMSEDVLVAALRTHPVAAFGREVCENPYCRWPLILSSTGEAHVGGSTAKTPTVTRVDWMVDQLRKGREAEKQRSELVAHRAAMHEAVRGREMLDRLLENIGDGFLGLETDWTINYANRAAEELLGRRTRELIGRQLWEAFPEFSASHVETQFRLSQREGTTVEFETYFSPSEHWFAVRVCPSNEGLAVFFRDISERKKSDLALREMQAELKAQVDELHRLHELNGRLTATQSLSELLNEVVDTALAMHGARMGTLSLRTRDPAGLRVQVSRGLSLERLKAVEFVPLGTGACGQCAERGVRVIIEDTAIDPLYTQYRDWAREAQIRSVHCTPLITRGGRLVGVLSIYFPERHLPTERETKLLDLYSRMAADLVEERQLRDRMDTELAQRRRAEEHLRVSESRFLLAAQSDVVTLYEQDAELRYTWLYPEHPEHAGALGKTDQEILGEPEGGALAESKWRVLRSGVAERIEISATLPGGRRYYDMSISPKRNAAGEIVGVAGVSLDVSDRKAIEQKLRNRTRALEVLNGSSAKLAGEFDVEKIVETSVHAGCQIAAAAGGVYFPVEDPEAPPFVWHREGEDPSLRLPALIEEARQKLLEIAAAQTQAASALRAAYSNYGDAHGVPFAVVPVISRTGSHRGGLLFFGGELSLAAEDRLGDLETLAAQTSIAIDNANLYAALQNEIEIQRGNYAMRSRLAAIVESSEDAIVSKDLTGKIMTWNRGAERIFGYTAEEAIGRSITILIPTERISEEAGILDRISSDLPIDHFETVRRHKSGRLLDVALTVSPIHDADGRVIGASKIARDVTERKRSEQQQQALYDLIARVNRAEALTEIYDAAVDAICRSTRTNRASILIYDGDRVMRFKAWRGLSDGYRAAVEGHSPWKPDELNAQPVCIPNVLEAELDESLRQTVLREGIQALAFIPLTYEKRLLGKFMLYYQEPHEFGPEDLRPAETIASQVAFAIERQKSGEALEKLVDQRTASLREAIAQMEEFSYSVSHDLRSPVRAMQGYARAFLEDFGERLDPSAREYLDRIIRSGTRMDRLIQDVLIYSRLSRREIELKTMDLAHLVRELIEQYPELQAPRATISVAKDLGTVIAHEASVSQALANLLSNAVKFVAPGTTPHVVVRSERRGPQLRLWVEDNGIGVRPEHHQRLFGLFERIHPDHRYEGTGIGLAIVRRAVERMGGAVGLESDGEHGSKFWIQLPAA